MWWLLLWLLPPPRPFSPRCAGRGCPPGVPAVLRSASPRAHLGGDAERRRLRRGHRPGPPFEGPRPGVRGRSAGGSPGRDASWVRGLP